MNEDTRKLLEAASMNHALEYAKDDDLKYLLQRYKEKHKRLEKESAEVLHKSGYAEKEPGMMASAFSWITAETKLMMNDGNNQIAKLMMNGANMGIQSVTEYRHQYAQADDTAQTIAGKLIRLEEEFLQELKKFL